MLNFPTMKWRSIAKTVISMQNWFNQTRPKVIKDKNDFRHKL